MYQTSNGNTGQMSRYTNLEFDREIWAGDLSVEARVRRLSETTKGGSVIKIEEEGLCLDTSI